MKQETMKRRNQPLYIKLSLFTKKKVILFLVLFIFFISMYPLFIVEDKASLFIRNFGFIITMVLQVSIAYMIGQLIFSELDSIFGVDIKQKKVNLSHRSELLNLFEEGEFQNYQNYVVERLLSKRILLITLILAIVLTFFGWVMPMLMKSDVNFEIYPELIDDRNYYLYLLLAGLPSNILTFILVFTSILIFVLLFEVVLCFHALSESPGLSLNQIPKMIQRDDFAIDEGKISERSVIMKFSLKRFQRQSKIVPNHLLKVNLAIVLSFLIGGISILWMFYGVGSSGDAESITYGLALWGLFMLVSGLINILLFLLPQWSFHNQLERVKGSMIESIEDIFELKKFKFLQIVDKDAKDEKESLAIEMQTLSSIIEDIENIATWPFDYEQLVSLIGGILLPAILVIISIMYGEELWRN
ncbi:MAG: hypothetical protein ACXAC7_15555 [Candidatus Hodarchaeales archaeon]|jgi:hypothetical protein